MQITDTEEGVCVTSRYPFFRRYCEGWIEHLKLYHEALRDVGDWPFFYGERPLVGFLAAGIWSSEGICIEEFRTDKKPHIAKRSDDSRAGRGDLYFCHGDHEGNVEVKMRDVGISQSRDFAKFLKKSWNTASDDARRGHQRRIQDFAGIFFRPYIGEVERDASLYRENIRLFLEDAWALAPDALAWWCPVEQVLDVNDDKRYWPVGVVLLIKSV